MIVSKRDGAIAGFREANGEKKVLGGQDKSGAFARGKLNTKIDQKGKLKLYNKRKKGISNQRTPPNHSRMKEE